MVRTHERDWLATFTSIGMIWQHDGNPRRPFARLTSGLISDGFVNCTPLIMRPQLLREAVHDLVGRYRMPDRKNIVVGQAMGSITVADQIALELNTQMCWTVKTNDTAMGIDKRFVIENGTTGIIVEDVTTTGGTSKKTKRACEMAGMSVAPFLYTIINRSGETEIDGMEVRSLVNLSIRSWKFGENPHRANGMEQVEPVRPKENWNALTRDYPV